MRQGANNSVPYGEMNEDASWNSSITKTEAVSSSIQNVMPNVLNDIKGQIKSLITSTITEAITKMKEEVLGVVKNELVHIESRSNLNSLSEANLIES